jgi:hypothetical protein
MKSDVVPKGSVKHTCSVVDWAQLLAGPQGLGTGNAGYVGVMVQGPILESFV